jgi:hypothetical protein
MDQQIPKVCEQWRFSGTLGKEVKGFLIHIALHGGVNGS